MLAAYTKLKNAQKVKQFLANKELLSPIYLPIKELGYIYFPIIKKVKVVSAKVVNTKFSFPKKETEPTVDDLLKKQLTVKESKLIPRSQEIVGKIMVLEVPEQLEKKEKVIAEAYLKANKHIETVVKKKQIHSGEYRLRKVKILSGKRSKETVHQENGVKIKLNLEKTYFSARSANERLRIAKQVKKDESVLVMFSGAAPFPLVIAKNSLPKMIYGIEINPLAHQYALENVKLNNFDNKIRIFEGNVREILPKIRIKFDRIVMPLPKTGEEFLDIALKKCKVNGMIHLYAFLSESDLVNERKKIKQICQDHKHSVRILRTVKCGQFSPKTFRICFDIKVLS
jgi:tRNA (guanine37-N1)-methyltransferase